MQCSKVFHELDEQEKSDLSKTLSRIEEAVGEMKFGKFFDMGKLKQKI